MIHRTPQPFNSMEKSVHTTMSAISKLNPQIQSYAVFYYVKLQRPFVCLSVCTPPPFSTRPSDRNQIWHTYSGRYGTHSQQKNWPTPPQGDTWGFLGGQKNQKSGKWHELPRKHIFVISPGGGEGSFRGQHFKSSGNFMNCPENQYFFKIPVAGSGSFMNCRENRYIFLTPRPGGEF